MKLITLICESFNRYDIDGILLDGFSRFNFDNTPSNLSAKALYLMQTEQPLFDQELIKSPVFKDKIFIANFIKTRIFSNFWPTYYNISFLDPKANTECLDKIKQQEPANIHFKQFISFLKNDFYESDYQHLIYWPYIGHPCRMGLRVDTEDIDVPFSLSKTFSKWVSIIKEHILPLIKEDTLIFMHNDHGTQRLNMIYEKAIFDGFLWIKSPPAFCFNKDDTHYTWKDLRKTIRTIFQIDSKLPPNDGKIICWQQ